MRSVFMAVAVSASMAAGSAAAAPVSWVDWATQSGPVTGSFTATGTITVGMETVTVTYTNPQGIAFTQADGAPNRTDYWQNGRSGRNPATSPYTSSAVDNIPTGTDIIALRFAGPQTLSFSKTVENLVFAYVSLNGNGYGFDQDFDIRSFGHPSDGNDCGFWGCGTSSKNFDPMSGEYQLLGTGEPHGALQFTGEFDTVNWRSLSSENWNGFTVGITGVAPPPPPPTNPIPLPAAGWMLIAGLGALFGMRRLR